MLVIKASTLPLTAAYPDAESSVIEDERLNDLFLGSWECEKISTLQETQPADLALLQSSNFILQLTERDGKGHFWYLADLMCQISIAKEPDHQVHIGRVLAVKASTLPIVAGHNRFLKGKMISGAAAVIV